MFGTLTRAMRLTNDGKVVGVVFGAVVTFRSRVGRPLPPHAAAITIIAVIPASRARRRCTVAMLPVAALAPASPITAAVRSFECGRASAGVAAGRVRGVASAFAGVARDVDAALGTVA